MSDYQKEEEEFYSDRWANQDNFRPWGMDVKQFCLLMHLSQFAGYLIPFAGLILPIVMWATNKDHNEEVDAHGKEIINWMISMIIYCFIAFILTFVLVGIFVFIAIFIMGVIFPIIGAVQAGNGQFFKYPLTIRFFN
ncbi:MAG: DUF4870 domain-containing protein [Cyclobacteriaceae bacterium]